MSRVPEAKFSHQHTVQDMDRLRKALETTLAPLKNPNSRLLADAPGKSVDRHIAVFRKPPSD